MPLSTPFVALIVGALWYFRNRLYQFAYHRPERINVQVFDRFVGRLLFGLLLWIAVAMIFDWCETRLMWSPIETD